MTEFLMTFNILLITLAFLILLSTNCVVDGAMGKVIFGVNCGGDAHVDIHGIRYAKDPLTNADGIASDYGRQYLTIGRVPESDAVLYQTERYHIANFGYEIPVTEDGDYVLVLKFCEVYFNAPSMKVFDVTLNGVHTVVSYLDIYEKVGKAVAHDEYIPFKVSKGRLLVNDEESELVANKVKVEFIKGNQDNPKVNAIYVMKGLLEDVPRLPPLAGDVISDEEQGEESGKMSQPHEDDEEGHDDVTVPPPTPSTTPTKRKRDTASHNKVPNPYAGDETTTLLPIFVAIAAFVPFLFCLCKL